MPIYEYICNQCLTKFDKLRAMKDADAPLACPQCQSADTHRTISACFCQSEGRSLGSSGGHQCGGCSGGSCASCGH